MKKKENAIVLKITSCLDCEHHKVLRDPDPHDWFCDDDCCVVCKLTPNPRRDLNSEWASDRLEFRSITTSCRPYNIEDESKIPDWCPLLKK